MNPPIYLGSQALESLQQDMQSGGYSNILVLVDENTLAHCYPRIKPFLPAHYVVEIPSGEQHKNLATCSKIWAQMTHLRLDRHALMLNLGGGVIGDMGGFAASVYKRGIAFCHIPTSLLAQVDASVGGKLGIDFQSYKNQIGLFRSPQAVYIDSAFLQTLPYEQLRSGFAEVIKHHLIADKETWQTLSQIQQLDTLDFLSVIRHSVQIKRTIVEADFQEQGLRKALNFGHTIGHAIESYFLESEAEETLLHGEAIAIGMISEAFISHQRKLISISELEQIQQLILRLFPKIIIPTEAHKHIYQRMLQDKKNRGKGILSVLLDGIGSFLVDQEIEWEEVEEALLFYTEN